LIRLPVRDGSSRATETIKEKMMNQKIYSALAMLSLCLMLTVVSVQAQWGSKIEVTVPFDFQVGTQKLSAGEYTVQQLSRNSMLLVSADGQARSIISTPRMAGAGPTAKDAKEKLVFKKYGDQYFLSQVWVTRGAGGRELYQSDAERKAAREMKLANNADKPQRIEVEVGGR
jgi:hypothetical protein